MCRPCAPGFLMSEVPLGGLVFEAHRLLYHSTLGPRVIIKKKKVPMYDPSSGVWDLRARLGLARQAPLDWYRQGANGLKCQYSNYLHL